MSFSTEQLVDTVSLKSKGASTAEGRRGSTLRK